VKAVLSGAEAGTLTNFLDGEYRSRGKIDLLAYRTGDIKGPPEVVPNVDDLTKAVGTRSAKVPRAYVFPAKLEGIAEKLRLHNVQVSKLKANVRVEGEEFTIERMSSVRRSGYDMTTLDGSFSPVATRDFPAGSFYVDMAQPMANAAFYYLEPQSRDGFVGWRVLDEVLRELGVDKRPVVYPVFKVRRTVKKD
jgi:dipeptidyl-peptidase-4